MGDGRLGNGSGAIRGYIAHGNVPFPRRRHIDNVETCRQHADVAHLGQLRECLPRDRRLVGQQHVGIPRPFGNLCRCGMLENSDVPQGLQLFPAEVPGVQRIAVEDDDLHADALYCGVTDKPASSGTAAPMVKH